MRFSVLEWRHPKDKWEPNQYKQLQYTKLITIDPMFMECLKCTNWMDSNSHLVYQLQLASFPKTMRGSKVNKANTLTTTHRLLLVKTYKKDTSPTNLLPSISRLQMMNMEPNMSRIPILIFSQRDISRRPRSLWLTLIREKHLNRNSGGLVLHSFIKEIFY